MMNTVLDFFGGQKIKEKTISLQQGRLKAMLKERSGERYVYLRFSYPGNVQYHAIHAESIDEVIETLKDFRTEI